MQIAGLKLKVRLEETSDVSRARSKGIRISVHDADQLPSFAEDRGLFTTLGVDALIRFNQASDVFLYSQKGVRDEVGALQRALERYDNEREHCSDHWPLRSEQLNGLAYSNKVRNHLHALQSRHLFLHFTVLKSLSD